MENVKERHIQCPFIKDCTNTTYCHYWKTEVTDKTDGRLVIMRDIHDCDRPVRKV